MANFSSTNLLPLIIVILLLETPNPGGATWWYMSQLPIQALALVHNGAICGNIPGLIGRQRRLCRTHPDVMISVIDGAKLGVQECQYQFRSNRWNCSTSEKDSSVFGKIMLKVGSREAAFVYAISSAGVVHAITRACSKGELLNCACDPDKVGFGKDKRGSFEWGGCSDNVMYGSRFARKFVDARETDKRDARALMNMHNNMAGRRAVRKSRKLECKCHGVSGSCAIRTCWLAMHDFRQVGNMLRERYNGATQVMMDQTGTGLIVSHRNHKKPTRSDLVYFEASPDYCVQDPVTGSLGTAGRQCEKDSLRSDGCDIMCCGRGFDTRTVKRVRKCECKFHWCCYVKCKKCEEWRDIHTCKGPNPTVSPAIGSLARRPY